MPSRKATYEDSPAGVQYVGMDGITQPCIDAIARLLSYDDTIVWAKLLTCESKHAFWLNVEPEEHYIVKAGFSSGYGGEGPRGLSYALQLLDFHEVGIEELEVPKPLFDRANDCVLTVRDYEKMEKLKPIRPRRWHEYIWDRHEKKERDNLLWAEEFRPVIPFAIIDPRIADLAKSFWKDPDARLLAAYRRLEDLVRARTGLAESGTKLFSDAFHGKQPKLTWQDLPASELAARGQMFTGAFGTFRNPRGHRERAQEGTDLLAEFLVVNELFRLESKATLTAKSKSD